MTKVKVNETNTVVRTTSERNVVKVVDQTNTFIVRPVGVISGIGAVGLQGSQGPTGATGLTGAIGNTGATGNTGADGSQGIPGIQGQSATGGYPYTYTSGGVSGSGIFPIANADGEFVHNTSSGLVSIYFDDANGVRIRDTLTGIVDKQNSGQVRIVFGDTGIDRFFSYDATSYDADALQFTTNQIIPTGASGGSGKSVELFFLPGNPSTSASEHFRFPDGTNAVSIVTSFNGQTGAVTGVSSVNGQTGDITGQIGPTGNTGSQGDQGIQGVTGNTGSQGDQGIQGTTGNTGSQGDQGIRGVTGNTGSQGIQGTTGNTGADSTVAGPIGATGNTGPAGSDGATLNAGDGLTLSSIVAGVGYTMGIDPTATIHVAGISSDGGATFGGDINLLDNQLERPKFKDYAETVNVIGTVTSDTVVDVSDGNVQTVTVGGDCKFSFTNFPASGIAGTCTLIITNGGAHATTWNAHGSQLVRWPGEIAPSLTASGIDILSFITINGGNRIDGFVGGINFI